MTTFTKCNHCHSLVESTYKDEHLKFHKLRAKKVADDKDDDDDDTILDFSGVYEIENTEFEY